MLTLLDQLDKETLWRSPGGIHPPEVKFLSNTTPISQLPLAQEYLVPVPQVGENCTLAVKVGDKVLKGAPLTQGTSIWHLPVHAPTSGTVVAIEPRASNHASALPVNTCVIAADGEDRWSELTPGSIELSNQEMIAKIHGAGIAGMGGAAFPSHIKLNPVSEIELVIINGVECEPYISADDRLMREYSQDILAGIGIIHRLLAPKRIVIAIEDNKPEAIKAMQQAVSQSTLPAGSTRVTAIPTKYPSGGEKQLIQIITGREVPSGSIPAKLGIVVHNVGTAFAIHQAVTQGKPLIERVVTVTGQNVGKPGNYWLPIGTPVEHVLKHTEFNAEADQKVIIGGPMMGHALPTIQVPILKGTNCILVPSSQEIGTTPEEKACIRCGECANACPALLLPQQLFWHAKAEEYDKAASYNLKDCIECGCCSYVCPSDIPLVEYYRIAKSALKQAADEKHQAERAKLRFEARIQRLEEEKLAREAKAKEAAARRQATMTSTDKNAVAEAMARIAAKKAAAAETTADNTPVEVVNADANSTEAPKGKAAVAAAIARAKAKKAAAAAQSADDAESSKQTVPAEQTVSSEQSEPTEQAETLSQKDKVAAAIARAKAKKAALKADSDTNDDTDAATDNTDKPATETSVNAEADDKKAKVAAAVARAKAKKAAAQQAESTDVVDEQTKLAADAQPESGSIPNAPLSPEDEKKAKIAAAVARAKAKKAAAQQAESTEVAELQPELATDAKPEPDVKSGSESDSQSGNESSSIAEPNAPLSPEDEKKAKIAAAVARAKAKKAATQQAESTEVAEVQPELVAVAKPESDIESGSESDAELGYESDSQSGNESSSVAEPSAPLSPEDEKKAKIAAAVARAKAKKAAREANAISDANE
ncbi:electron transport complex subunit RsxC [Shewanella sp. GD03713]|uniref:electron transport complex subunit RsxC n=1 Tax=Shewanella sp. GD03713 TaxID=2975372 RepID=UPI000B341AC0|nr:electron transport complex subunit RsxC [Shewanella sp. GD03713]MDH1470506.1 electron transport complex subunit RsxC [Shewanella sp. GD03713]QXN23276.1 electron transport complex subunit RsxC [Shewanella putrefaciens]VEE64447.1 Nitrogen fixation protein rnfC [Shewanella putrefaciens]